MTIEDIHRRPRAKPWWRALFDDGEQLAREFRKAVGTTAAEVMTHPAIAISPAWSGRRRGSASPAGAVVPHPPSVPALQVTDNAPIRCGISDALDLLDHARCVDPGGRRMPRACDRMTLHELRRHLTTDVVGHHIYMFDTVTSTNEVLGKLADGGAPEGTVVLTETQTAGRGRHGTAWFSPEAANLYISVLFHPRIAPRELPLFAPIASLALAEAAWLESAPALIKWPNDVLVGGRKLGGTLIEAPVVGDRLTYVILGIGVNLNVERAELMDALGPLAEGAVSLQEIVEHEVDRNAFAAGLLNRLEKWYRTFGTRGPSAILAAWQARDALKGKRVEARTADGVCEGYCRGIQPDGGLLIDDDRGRTHRVLAGAVRLLEPDALDREWDRL